MSPNEVVERFERIAPVFDATRRPLEAEAAVRLVAALRELGAEPLLEVGVGTGRVAAPLRDLGVDLLGIDASRAMLARARAKGLSALLRGDATGLPFRDGAFPATLFAHVLHLFSDPAPVLSEAARVSRRWVLALVGTTVPPPLVPDPNDEDVRAILVEVLRASGHEVPSRARPKIRERAVLAAHQPDRSFALADRLTERSFEDELRGFQLRGDRTTMDAPPELLAHALSEVRRRRGDRPIVMRESLTLVAWAPARFFPPAGPKTTVR
jgi:SAM-dependent methyltransferase